MDGTPASGGQTGAGGASGGTTGSGGSTPGTGGRIGSGGRGGTGGTTVGGGGTAGGQAGRAGSGGAGGASAGSGGANPTGGAGGGPVGSEGCGKSFENGDHSLTIEVAGTTRNYLVVAQNYAPDFPHPVYFTMHGATWTGPRMRSFVTLEKNTTRGIHVFPDGIGGRWNLSNNGVDVQFFDAMVAWLRANTCIDSKRIFVHGFSMGGMISNTLGCARGNVVRAIAPSAGSGPSGNCVGQVGVLVMHGTDDPTVPYSWGQTTRDRWLPANSCGTTTTAVDPSPCVEYQGCDPGFPVVWCSHTGYAHWPPPYYADSITKFFGRF